MKRRLQINMNAMTPEDTTTQNIDHRSLKPKITMAQKQNQKKPKKTKSLERKRREKAMFLPFSFKETKETFEVTKITMKFQ